MDNQIQNSIVSFIWGIADDCLRDVYVRGKYRDVILPMTVIRRLDAMLEDTKTDVLKMKDTMDKAGITNQWPALCNAADQAFCNASPFLLKDLTSRAKKQTLKADFEAYLDGFSPNVQEILEKFKFRNQIDTMIDADILGAVIEKFVSPTINLSPKPVYTDDTMTTIKLLALDNHGMGTIFEELIRKFNEENNEEAGEHWTPRDVVELMADLIIVPVADQIMDATYSCYDGACGTGGMLTVAQDRLLNIAKRRGKNVSIHLFGQEVQPETYAICKADMLLKGDGDQADHIAYGSTLSADGNATRQFDFMLANPPYGKSWKTDAEKMGGKKDILDSRFNAYLEDGTQLSMIPRTSDGQLLFLLNNVAKMKKDTPLGSRIAEVHNGSSIFTGDAGSGESNARRYLIENDLVEAIIALPENMFYNTGIGTFIWVAKINASVANIVKVLDDEELLTFLPMENVSERGEIDCSIKRPLKEIKSGYSSFAKGDVVVAKITPCFENGKGACLDTLDTEIGFGTTEFINLRPGDEILSRYLYMITMTQHFRKLGERVMTGSAGQKRISANYIKNFTLGIPAIKEQEEILKKLDSTLSKIDELIEIKKSEISGLHELKNRLISDVVTGNIDVRDIEMSRVELSTDAKTYSTHDAGLGKTA